MGRFQNFVAELRRRRVFRAIVAYAIASFALLQVIEPVMHGLDLPDWVLKLVVIALGIGFPITVVLAWAFDLKATGIERAAPAGPGDGGAPPPRGARLALLLVGIGMLFAAPALLYYLVFSPAAGRTAPGVRAAAAGPLVPSVAVLPFVDMSPQKDQEYFSDGLAEEILNLLAHVDGLRVTGRTSSFSFRGQNEDLRAIGQKLNVGAVLEGSVRKEGNRIRVTAQVVKVADGFHMWSETYDRELSGVFAVQDDIARAVVEALKVRLLPGGGPKGEVRPANPEAYTQFLLGRQLWNRLSKDSVRRSAEAFQRSVELDPTYAPAWAALAMAAQDAGHDAPGSMEQAQRRARAAAERAIQLDPQLAEGYNARGVLRAQHDWDWQGAQADLDRARALQPGDAVSQRRYGVLRLMLGKPAEAIAALKMATELDPLSAISWTWLGRAHMAAGDLAQAKVDIERAAEIVPDSEDVKSLQAVALLLTGNAAQAVALLNGMGDEGARLIAVALAEHDRGHAAEVKKALDEFTAKFADHPYNVAVAHAWLGSPDQAFEWLERAIERRDLGLTEITFDPLLGRLRGDPRFALLLRKMNLPVL